MKTQRRKDTVTKSGELNFAPSSLSNSAPNASAQALAPAGQRTIAHGDALGSVPGDAQRPGCAEDGEWPEGWRLWTLGEATGMKQGEILGTHEMNTSGFPVFGANGRIGFYHRFTHKHSEVLVTCRGSTCGTVNVSPAQSFITNNAMVVTPLDPAALERSFLALALQVADLSSTITGTGQPQITKGKLAGVAIPVPTIPEQKAIASVSRTVQGAKEACERVLAATRQLKQSLLHHLFTYGPVPFPQAAHVSLKETEIGEIPEGWDLVRLAELIDIKHGYAFKGEFFEASGKYVLLTPGHFHEGGGFRDQRDKTKYYTGEFPGGYLLQKDDLLVAMTEQTSGLLGSTIMVPESGKFLHNQRLGLILNPNETRLDKLFLYYWFAKPDIRSQIEQTATGTKVHHTSPGRIRDLLVALPGIGEQREIAGQLAAVDAKLVAVESRRAALTVLFQSLLHHLMTGQVRLPEFATGETYPVLCGQSMPSLRRTRARTDAGLNRSL
jgi:restriction endonuclease S subunit